MQIRKDFMYFVSNIKVFIFIYLTLKALNHMEYIINFNMF